MKDPTYEQLNHMARRLEETCRSVTPGEAFVLARFVLKERRAFGERCAASAYMAGVSQDDQEEDIYTVARRVLQAEEKLEYNTPMRHPPDSFTDPHTLIRWTSLAASEYRRCYPDAAPSDIAEAILLDFDSFARDKQIKTDNAKLEASEQRFLNALHRIAYGEDDES